jgi:hypothetical protein
MSNGNDAHARRVQALMEGTKALILVNGGAAVSLLAFLQAIWDKPYAKTMIQWSAAAFLVFGAGVALTSGGLVFRYWRSMRPESLSPDDPLRSRELLFYVGSGLLFFVGVVLATIGGLCAASRMA